MASSAKKRLPELPPLSPTILFHHLTCARLRRGILLVFLLGLFLMGQEAPRPAPEWKRANVPELMARLQKDNPSLVSHLFAENENCTVNLLAPRALIPAHYHLNHDEIVFIIRGSGTMRVHQDEFLVQAGDILFIPRKTVHSFSPSGADVLALSIFVPKFDGKDRIFGETPPP
jgi:mannose-6-phosphate isomerase-like protein (cupin superfamily)